jgi:hypothetical protein
MTYNRWLRALAAIALLVNTEAIAQDNRGLRERTVPLELVQALLSTPLSALPPNVAVGEIPPPMQGNVFVPTGARILGGTFTSADASVIIASSQPPMALEALLRSEHLKMGWKPLAFPGASGGGFRDASGSGANSVLCRSGASLMVQVTLVRAGESRIRMNSGASGICSNAERISISNNSGDPFAGIQWPVLVNPPNARGMGSCPMGRFLGGMQSAELTTQAPLAELMSHYTRQLVDSGWAKSPGETVAQAFTKRDVVTGSTLQLRVVGSTYDGFASCRRMSLETGVVR